MNARGRRVLATAVVAVAALLIALPSSGLTSDLPDRTDLSTYLAAGRAWAGGYDPSYLQVMRAHADVADPVHWLYPSWTLPGFALLATLGTPTATMAWDLGLVAAIAIAAALWTWHLADETPTVAAAVVLASHLALRPAIHAALEARHLVPLEAIAAPVALMTAAGSGAFVGGLALALAGGVRLQGLALLAALASWPRGDRALQGAVAALAVIAAAQLAWPQEVLLAVWRTSTDLGGPTPAGVSTPHVLMALTGWTSTTAAAMHAAVSVGVVGVTAAAAARRRRRGMLDPTWTLATALLTLAVVSPRQMTYDGVAVLGAFSAAMLFAVREGRWAGATPLAFTLVAAWTDTRAAGGAPVAPWVAGVLGWFSVVLAGATPHPSEA